MIVFLNRHKMGPHGTLGELVMDGAHLCYTLEDPWNDNKTGVSCIPAGTYNCKPHNGAKFKNVWEVTKVPGRAAILIHAGNTEDDTHGCILVGKTKGSLSGKPAVLQSVCALNELRATLPEFFTLTVSNP